MGIETYFVIAACYACGCLLSYNLGWRNGANLTFIFTLEAAAKYFKMRPLDLALKIRDQEFPKGKPNA